MGLPRLAALVAVATLGACNWVLGLDEVHGDDDDEPTSPFASYSVTIGARPAGFAIGDVDQDDVLDAVVVTGSELVVAMQNHVVAGALETEAFTTVFDSALQLDTVALVPQVAPAPPEVLALDRAGTAYRVMNDGGALDTTAYIWPDFGAMPGTQLLIGRFEPAETAPSTVLVATPGLQPVLSHRLIDGGDARLTDAMLTHPFVAWAGVGLGGDATGDLVIATTDGVGLYLGREVTGPFGPFGAPVQELTSLAAPIAAGALDADGRGDAVATLRGTPSLIALFGDGAGGVNGQATIALDLTPTAIAVLDLGKDGTGDVAAAGGLGANTLVQLARADGAHGFTTSAPFEVPGQLVDLAVADFDRDGRDDLALLLATSPTDGEVRFLLQR